MQHLKNNSQFLILVEIDNFYRLLETYPKLKTRNLPLSLSFHPLALLKFLFSLFFQPINIVEIFKKKIFKLGGYICFR
jgi:hypothetical protein